MPLRLPSNEQYLNILNNLSCLNGLNYMRP